MFQKHSSFHRSDGTSAGMNYVVLFLNEPIFASPNWLDVHQWTLRNGYAVNALGCIWTKMPGVTIQQPRIH